MSRSYGIIYSDPPWEQRKGGARKCRPKQGKELDYPTLTVGEIFDLHKQFFSLTEEKHNVFMWTIDKFLVDTQEAMASMGYDLHARIVWDKENGVAPAFTVRFTHEYLLWFYRKGNMLMPTKDQRGKWTTVIRETSQRHSQKPEIAYRMIETLFPDAAKIELFARNKRDNWDCWGNEVSQ